MSGLTRRQYLAQKQRRLNELRVTLRERVDALLSRLKTVRTRAATRPILSYEQHETLDRLESSLRGDRRYLAQPSRPSLDFRLKWIDEAMTKYDEQLSVFERLLVSEPLPV